MVIDFDADTLRRLALISEELGDPVEEIVASRVADAAVRFFDGWGDDPIADPGRGGPSRKPLRKVT